MKKFEIIQQFLRTHKELMTGNERQTKFYEQQLNDLTEVHCKSVKDVLTSKEIEEIHNKTILIQNECYSNSLHVTQILSRVYADVRYVEGMILAGDVMPLPHAFVRIGDSYIDPTLELMLNKDVEKETYGALGEWTCNYALSQMAKWGTYGDVYINSILQDYK